MLHFVMLLVLGFAVGTLGTLVGAGGGFVLMPVLLLLYPHDSPSLLTSISLAVVFFNALSGSIAYGLQGRIDYYSGARFSLATIPGAILGAITTAYLPRRWFDLGFSVVLLISASYLMLRGQNSDRNTLIANGYVARTVTEVDGTKHSYVYDPRIGIGLSVLVGYVSSLLGIGGGVIHVPALVHLLHFPVHIATATSHFILAVMSFAGTAVHVVTGVFHRGVHRTAALSVGVVLGAQLGAWFSNRVHGAWIIRGLGIALGFVGARIFIIALLGTAR